jgi:hypothetical protein
MRRIQCRHRLRGGCPRHRRKKRAREAYSRSPGEYLHARSGRDKRAFAFGGLIVGIVIAGSLWIV